jgi:hypothetical protein
MNFMAIKSICNLDQFLGSATSGKSIFGQYVALPRIEMTPDSEVNPYDDSNYCIIVNNVFYEIYELNKEDKATIGAIGF